MQAPFASVHLLFLFLSSIDTELGSVILIMVIALVSATAKSISSLGDFFSLLIMSIVYHVKPAMQIMPNTSVIPVLISLAYYFVNLIRLITPMIIPVISMIEIGMTRLISL